MSRRRHWKGRREFITRSTQPEELALADKVRATPLDIPQRASERKGWGDYQNKRPDRPSTEETEQVSNTPKPEDRKRQVISAPLMEYLMKRPGQEVFADEIAKDIGRSYPEVVAAISNLRSRKGMNIQTVIPARAWRYMPESKEDTTGGDTLFKLLGGPTKDGAYVLEREDGTLFRAVEL